MIFFGCFSTCQLLKAIRVKLGELCWTWVKHLTWFITDICLTCCCNVNSHIWYYISWFSGTLNNTFKSDGGASFLLSLWWKVVYGRVGYCPLSCLLYTLTSLRSNCRVLHGVGCQWKGLFVGCLCYADDLAVLAPAAYALRRMLKICSEFAAERNLVFNAGKTQLICFCWHRTIVVDDCIEYCGQKTVPFWFGQPPGPRFVMQPIWFSWYWKQNQWVYSVCQLPQVELWNVLSCYKILFTQFFVYVILWCRAMVLNGVPKHEQINLTFNTKLGTLTDFHWQRRTFN